MPNVYTPRNSHTGNRWWVAYNVGQSLFSKNLFSPSGYEAVGSGNATDDAIFAKAAAATASAGPQPAGKGPVVHVQNIGWANVNGPYPSYAAAQAAIAGIQAAAPAPGTTQQATKQAQATVAAANPFGGLISALTNGNLWIRVGEALLGVVLLAIGVARLTHAIPAATRIATTVGAVA
jgi:hypothetical protein